MEGVRVEGAPMKGVQVDRISCFGRPLNVRETHVGNVVVTITRFYEFGRVEYKEGLYVVIDKDNEECGRYTLEELQERWPELAKGV